MTPTLSTDKLEAILAELRDEVWNDGVRLAGPTARDLLAADAIEDLRRERDEARARLTNVEGETWRCFHCGDVFIDEDAARMHFGVDESRTPACLIKAGAEGSLVRALREAEDAAAEAIHKMHDESTDGYKAYYAGASRHRAQLQAAEEAGYEKGLADARAEAAERELAIVKEGGWKLVPVEPTEAMAEAGERARFEHTDQYFDGSEVSHGDVAEHIYRAMIAAAPLPPVPALNGDQE